MAIPGSVAGTSSYSVISTYGIYHEDILKKLNVRVPQVGALSWTRRIKGRLNKRKATRTKYSHFEAGQWYNAKATIAAKNTGTANTVVVTLSSGDHRDSGTRSYPVVGNLALFPNQTVGLVTAKSTATPSAHTVTIKAVNASQDVQAAATVGGHVVFVGNAQKEGSTAPESRIPQFTRVDNYISITRAAYKFTDLEAQNELWFEPEPGKPYLYVQGIEETSQQFEMDEDFKMLTGVLSDGLSLDAGGNAVQVNAGLVPQIAAGGINGYYYGQPDLDMFNEMELRIDSGYGDDEYLYGMGINASQGLRNWLWQSATNSRNIPFVGVNKQDIKVNFTSMEWGDKIFHFDTWAGLSHNDSLGAAGFPYRHMIIGIPLGGGTKYDENKNRMNASYMSVGYAMPEGGGNELVGDVKIWEDGGNARPRGTSDELVRRINMVSYKSLELFCVNKFIKYEKADI